MAGMSEWKDGNCQISLEVSGPMAASGPFPTAHIQACAQRQDSQKVFASLSLFPEREKGAGRKKNHGRRKIYGQKLIWGVSFPVAESEQSQAMQRSSKWSRWCSVCNWPRFFSANIYQHMDFDRTSSKSPRLALFEVRFPKVTYPKINKQWQPDSHLHLLFFVEI